jgi:pimeloyl-ACP methyl ester carboxylesterase
LTEYEKWRELRRPGQVIDVGTVRLWYDEEGEGEPLLLLSGFAAGHNLFDFVWPELEGYRRLTLEPRGLGRSDRPEPPYGVDVWADDAVRLLDKLGIERTHIWATAFGSYYSIRLVANHPERVGAFITYTDVWHGDPAKGYAEFWKVYDPIVEVFGTSERGMKVFEAMFDLSDDPSFIEWTTVNMQENIQPDRHKETAGYGLTEADVRTDLARIKVPTLVLQGTESWHGGELHEEDDLSLQLMKDAIPGLDVARIPGHPVFVIAQKPRECADAVRAFLARHPLELE